MKGETVEDVLREVDEEVKRRRERRLPKWMREPSERHRLTPAKRKARRYRNERRAQLRPLVRSRRRHGRPRGR